MLRDNLKMLKNMIHIDYDSNIKMIGYCGIVCVNLLLLIGQTANIVESWGDIVKISSCLAAYGLKLQVCYKLFVLYWEKNRIMKMHKYIKNYFWDTNAAGRTIEDELNKLFKLKILLFLAGFLTMVMVVYVWFCFFPLVIYPPEIRTLPLQISLPFDTNPSPLHELLYIILCTSGSGNILIIVLFDFLFVYFCQHLVVQFKVLQEVLPKLIEHEDSSNDVEILRNDKIQLESCKRLNTYIRHHVILIEFGNELKSFSSIDITIPVTMSMLSLITLGFGITKVDYGFTKLEMVLLFTSLIVEVALYGVHGSELEHQMNAQKENKISAAGCVVINNMTIVQIFRAVFSAITLLQSLDED